jgi:hypothetical protein
VHDLGTIDSELWLLVAVRRVRREESDWVPSIGLINELLDERIGTRYSTKITQDRCQATIVPHG